MESNCFNTDIEAEKRKQNAMFMSNIQGCVSDAEKYEKIIDLLGRHIIPETYPTTLEQAFAGQNELAMESLLYRDIIVQNSGFALISNEWVKPLAQWIGTRRCLEIMAGSGALSFALAQNGVTVIATDNKSWSGKYDGWFRKAWTTVEEMNCLEAIERYARNCEVVICSWPYMDDDAYNALIKMRSINPNATMIYIGEWSGGATASSKFFEAATVVSDPAFSSSVKNFKQMYGIDDHVHLIR